MSKESFKVSLAPKAVIDKIKDEENADLVYEEFFKLGDDKFFGTLIFEKYFIRVSSRVALAVMVNNIDGYTKVTAVSTGSSEGIIFNFDWGASGDFANSVRNILKRYIIE